MNMSVVVCTAAAAVLALPAALAAQTFETVGVRAQGMGGAFVAVADDATATWWNPAGIATGAFFNALWERGSTINPGEPVGSGPAWRGDNSGFALAFPALGLSYYRLRVSEIEPSSSTGGDPDGRQDQGGLLRTRPVSQFGITAGQSVGSVLVVATTLKLVRAGRAAGTTELSGEDALEAATELETDAETSVGLDAGAMLRMGHVRAGVTIRNLREPEFGEGDERFELERHVRAGLAVLSGQVGLIDGVTLAVDADLTTIDTVLGEARHVAFGAELLMFRRYVGLRGGITRNVAGLERTSTSAGLSFAVQSGVYVDGLLTFGSDETRKGWGIGARVTF